ncbi:Cell surface protein precursor with Cna protein B-type domain and Gram-positive cocci surface proteins LPxTG motif profile [Bifidobacterium goeldii]|uniref:Cell surface protein with Cna protein B-type domain and Gram-positive cocci surface proteins LPxTG motif profile n=1 Tax=Bifidobacterium goeldii TaxID=2306975 RepID=A0A430FCM4_9BIFI|nr:SpaA isopeptide-forming pilin-related protein [Bifidobacterium goeldii]RSX50586.1 Cell surface protein precursor with Cna protein B-type domain and Gram-positive cocci surface proteins LPxTG motif profile [Bifidobacterium goeldii]
MSIRYTRKRTDGGTTPIRSAAAGLLAISMMLGTALTGAITAPYAAYGANSANDPNLAAVDTAGICTPRNIQLGDTDSDVNGDDTGVATYVGGDMYIGQKPADTNQITNDNGTGPTGSYAAEMEGLTYVNGNFLLHPLKGFFTIGNAQFGGKFNPANGQSVLAVNGKSSTYSQVDGNANVHAKTWENDFSGKRQGAGISDVAGTSPKSFHAYIAGAESDVEGGTVNPDAYRNKSVYHYDSTKTGQVHWNSDANALNTVNGIDMTKYLTDSVKSTSTVLANSKSDKVTVTTTGLESLANYKRYKYNWDSGQASRSYEFTANSGTEKIIEFKGDKNDKGTQYFTINAADLSTAGTDYTGVSFKFTDINAASSVVVNVDASRSSDTVDFTNGWRFWWNGTEISNGYRTQETTTVKNAYSHASQSIMWNFYNAKQVTIRGGVANHGTWVSQNVNGSGIWGGNNEKPTDISSTDDPAAAMLGSIMVPNGSFESHVTTNGRVWVGGDLSMYNPASALVKNSQGTTVIFGANAEGVLTGSTSIIDMDQERHNLPWSGSASSECSAIGWQKVDSANPDTHLKGSTWGVYPSADDATNGTNQLLLVVDNGNNDSDPNEGVIKVGSLNPNATYYIKELKAPTGYELSGKIYTVTTNSKGDTVNKVSGVTDDSVTVTDGKITNKVSGASIQWAKVAEGDTSTDTVSKGLSGSEWTLTKKASGADTDQSWTVQDNTYTVTGVTVYKGDATVNSLTMQAGDTIGLTAKVTPSGASQAVTWISSVPTVADVNASGGVMALQAGSATIKACAVSDVTVCAQVIVTVKSPAVSSIEIHDSTGATVKADDTLNMKTGGTLTLTAVVDPSTVKAVWSSSDTKIATVNAASGIVTGVDTGTVTITAKAGNKTATVMVRVTDDQNTLVYIKKSIVANWGDAWLYYGQQGSAAGTWKFVHLEASCNSDYLYAEVPRLSGNYGFDLHDANNTSSSANWWPGGTGKDVLFNDRTIIVVDEYRADNKYSETAPDCTYAAETASAQSADQIAEYESVDETELVAQPAADTDTSDTEAQLGSVTADGRALAECGIDKEYRCDINGKVGVFQINDLTDGTYTLKEKTAPDGYELNETTYEFTVANGKVAWADGKKPSILTDGTAAIVDKPTEVAWSKVDNVHNAKLPGSQWKITGPSPKTDTYCVADNVNGTSAAIDGCDGTKLDDTNTEAGQFKVKGLAFGTYTLIETKAPAGYEKTATVYTITVSQTGSTITASGSNATLTDLPNTSTPVDVEVPVKKTVTGGSWPKNSDGTYTPFTFKITKWDDSQPGTIPVPNGCNSLTDCSISIAPDADATGGALNNVTANFGKIQFHEGALATQPGADGTYAQTYVYKVTEVTGTDTASVEYSKAEYKVEITVKHKKVNSALQGLEVTTKITQTKTDAGTNTNTDVTNTGTSFTNTIRQIELPATGGMGADVLVKWGLVVTLIALAGVAITARRCKQQ